MTLHTITAVELPILDIFCDKYLFRVPSYQRPYAWTIEQAGELLDDILIASNDEGKIGDISPYFLGSIVLIKDPQHPESDIVDGQQRLTTLTILLSVLRDLCSGGLADALHKYVCQTGDPIKGTEDVFRITTRERDAEFFQSHIQNRNATSNLPDARQFNDARARMIENAVHLRVRLQKETDNRLVRLAQFIAQRCYLVIVAASDQDSAFRIFSVLNSRGLDLSPADILKAEIIGALPSGDQEKYTDKWETIEDDLGRLRFAELFGHIRMIHRKQKMQGTLIAEFRNFVDTYKSPKKFIKEELRPYAKVYDNIINQNFSAPDHAPEINKNLKYLSRLDNFDWQPPAIEVIARHGADPAFIARFIADLERLAYGLFLLRRDPSDRIRRYGQLLAAIQSGEDLFDDKSSLQLSGQEKKEIIDTLSGDIYSIIRIRLPLLLRLDEYLSKGSATYETKTISVEHVLPQSPADGSEWLANFPHQSMRDAWVHKIANLVLLTRRKNSSASNYDFKKKKEKYFSTKSGATNFYITNAVLLQDEWTLDVLEGRQASLIAEMKTMWRLN